MHYAAPIIMDNENSAELDYQTGNSYLISTFEVRLVTVSAQIKGHSQLDRHFDIILIKRHFFALKVPFLGIFEANIEKKIQTFFVVRL